jgi:hypothetical protein
MGFHPVRGAVNLRNYTFFHTAGVVAMFTGPREPHIPGRFGTQ